ncbi:MAG: RNA methyltransferase [Candidatus Omnitrophica bacterium]|nr:RNA methyltransferase [Candidatus Omnitrophota bacterium]
MPYDKITSLTNSRIKHVVQLRSRKQRMKDGLMIVEGAREIARALEAGIVFKELYICRELLEISDNDQISATSSTNLSDIVIKKAALKNVAIYETAQAVFSKISYGDRSEGVLAVCAPKPVIFKDFSSKKHPLFVVVECVEKPGNLGAILRTCDGAGIDGVIICDGKTDIYNPNVIRASLGMIFSIKTVVSSNKEALEFLKSRNIKICATLPLAKTVYTKAQLTDALAVVVGSEQSGLTNFWVEHADLKVKIPMRGFADSLNVSVSTAILLYETIRQRSN